MAVEDNRCKDCKFFHAWEASSLSGRNEYGVCVAVRPALPGPGPDREVHHLNGSGCHAFHLKEATHDHACDDPVLDMIRTTLEDIARGHGMYGIDGKEDCQWAMKHADNALAALQELLKDKKDE